MKKKHIILAILSLLLLSGCSHKYLLSEDIITVIDKNCNGDNSIQLSLKEITDFEWDKCVVFDYGSSNSEISDLLGVDYNGITDGHRGIVFAYNEKIVYQETMAYDPDCQRNFSYYVERPLEGPTCVAYTYDNAILEGTRSKIDGGYFYTLTAAINKLNAFHVFKSVNRV